MHIIMKYQKRSKFPHTKIVSLYFLMKYYSRINSVDKKNYKFSSEINKFMLKISHFKEKKFIFETDTIHENNVLEGV